MTHQADHFTGFDVETHAFKNAATTMPEAHITNRNSTLNTLNSNRIGWLGNTRTVIQNVKNSLRTGSGFLCVRHNAAH
jgi:hypothetical protein